MQMTWRGVHLANRFRNLCIEIIMLSLLAEFATAICKPVCPALKCSDLAIKVVVKRVDAGTCTMPANMTN
jgi:hypothetical protein